MAVPPDFDLADFVRRTFAEDLGKGGDVTSNATIAEDMRFTAEMNARQSIVVAGIEIARQFFQELDPHVEAEVLAGDGDKLDRGATLMRLTGNARAMLAAERSALNTLQHLSGIATLTRQYVDAIAGTGTVLIDTRKTIPGLRVLEKYAVRMANWPAFNKVYVTYFAEGKRPARSAFGANGLALGALIELECQAYAGKKK